MPDKPLPSSRRWLVAILAAVLVAAALVAAALVVVRPWESGRLPADPGGEQGPTSPPPQQNQDDPRPPLTWSPPDLEDPEVLTITEPGRYDLEGDRDYRIEAPSRIDGPVELRGGGDIVWVGGHIHIPDQGEGPVPAQDRRALVISDVDDERGDAETFGSSPDERIVHVEGLRIDGPDLAEGINTNAPRTVVQLQNIHVDGVHFRGADDRDGTHGWQGNHPDVVQTWGSQAELRIDGLTGTSAYQGLFLKEDVRDRTLGPVWLRRVDLRAIQHEAADGTSYAGHRMLAWYEEASGELRIDSGTVYVTGHPASGWNRAEQNPASDTAFWRDRYRDPATGELVDEPSPGGAEFTDALGDSAPDLGGEDEVGTWAGWSEGPLGWDGSSPARIHEGPPPDGPYVPADSVGPDYRTPGYAADVPEQ